MVLGEVASEGAAAVARAAGDMTLRSRVVLGVCCLLIVGACTTEASPVTTLPATTAASDDSSTTSVVTEESPTTALDQSSTTSTTRPLAELVGFDLERVDVDVEFAVLVFAHPVSGATYVVDKVGRIVPIDGGHALLDISDAVADGGERGLLGAAFHADGRLFVHYTDNSSDTVVSWFPVKDGVADRAAERIILQVDQPANNHNGGMIQFGPDGYLYRRSRRRWGIERPVRQRTKPRLVTRRDAALGC